MNRSPGTVGRRPRSGPRFTLRQLGSLGLAYWFSRDKRRARTLTLVLVLLTMAQVALAIWLNYWNRALFDALDERSLSNLLREGFTFIVIFVLTMAVTAVHLLVKRRLQLRWRQWLTERLVGSWMAKGHHYRLLNMPGEHDNPDGRIAEDIRIATETAVALGHTLLFAVLILGSFIDILWSVSGTANVPGTSAAVPGYMVLLAFMYAGVGTALSIALGKPLIGATNRLQTAEANFRFGLAHSRENSEAIALLHGEAIERRKSRRLFNSLALRWNRQSLAYLWIVSFSTGYGTLLPVFPILIAAPQYISGAMTLGVLMQAAQAFQRLTSALSWPIDSLGDIAKCRASGDRVLSLYRDLQRLEASALGTGEHRIAVHRNDSNAIEFKGLAIESPDGKPLLAASSAEIKEGERVLLLGDSAAMSALFRVLAGVWPWGRGVLKLPLDRHIDFMPQRPYLPAGTLRMALSYPYPDERFDAQSILNALERAGMTSLIPRLDDVEVWDRALPLRAQQRLMCARVLLHRPDWVLVEESAEALDPLGANALLEVLHRELPNATVVTVSAHSQLARFHTRIVTLAPTGADPHLDASNVARAT
jgi:putative ATP-binding cassette transporter